MFTVLILLIIVLQERCRLKIFYCLPFIDNLHYLNNTFGILGAKFKKHKKHIYLYERIHLIDSKNGKNKNS